MATPWVNPIAGADLTSDASGASSLARGAFLIAIKPGRAPQLPPTVRPLSIHALLAWPCDGPPMGKACNAVAVRACGVIAVWRFRQAQRCRPATDRRHD